MKKFWFLLFYLGCISSALQAQTYMVYGKVLEEGTNKVFEESTVFIESLNVRVKTDIDGYYELRLSPGVYQLEAFSQGMNVAIREIDLSKDIEVNFFLTEFSESLDEVEVIEEREQSNGISRLRAVEGFGIYEAKKNELIVLDDFAANKVTNNARQIFAKVPGLNIWESDCAGLQLDIAARGLGPSRTANFNTRQNGYDMSADALGYPESYYTPPIQAVERIEIVRGAASLQYGTQFGGMLNFKLKEAPNEPFELTLEQSVGSFDLFNTFVSIGGTLNKWDYYGFYQYRTGDCWRDNSCFDSHQAFASTGYQVNEKLRVKFEYSFLNYETQQPGGLTDEDFEVGNLEQSRRDRNWFRVSWNLLASVLDYKISERTKLNMRSFGLFSSRNALGNLEQINRPDDPNQNRTLIRDEFENFGTEIRLLNYFNLFGKKSVLLVGGRYFDGLTDRKQGDASASSTADFSFLNPDDPEEFDYEFPSENYALFAENIFNISDRFSITPGVRFERIRTRSKGTWKQTVRNFAGEIETVNEFTDDNTVSRSFVLLGVGASYYLKERLNVYANFSENYRSVTFSDLRLNNPNFLLDSLITDESGYNADLGIRGYLLDWLNVDVSIFYLRYNDRIGVLLPVGTTLLFRTNIGDSRHFGLESFLEMDVYKMLGLAKKNTGLSVFTNLSLIDAEYITSQDNAIEGNEVEYVPEVMLRSGVNYSWENLKATYQISYLSRQFSDATNSTINPSALTGLIPSYYVMDLSFEYKLDRWKATFGVNNFMDEKYFTRRAESYPGPGIIPATIRSYYVSIGVKI